MIPDLDRTATIIRDVAETEILPRFRSLGAGEIREKGPGDLVTVADEASEHALTARLRDLLPGSVVVGEEAVSADASVLDRLNGDGPVWVVDPVDGTNNFAHGRPIFGVIVALVRRGETLAGWIHDPSGGRMAVVERGQGAWMDGRRLNAAAAAPLAEMRGFLSTKFYAPEARAALEGRKGLVRSAESLLCAAHEYLRLAGGEAHFAIYRRIMPWDHAAGILLVTEAGGHAALLDGSPYGPCARDGGLLVAPDQESWRLLERTLLAGIVTPA